MEKFIADLHFHSKYSRAVSPKMELLSLAQWARKKGIDLLTTADFTHFLWLSEIKKNLKEVRPGIYRSDQEKPLFILTTEIALIFGGHRIHLLIFAPNIETVEKINQVLAQKNFNLNSDGRPILGTSVIEFTRMITDISPEILIVPAHVWTPWFSLYGSRSGFDSINECFGEYTDQIMAVETGLSSDPLMNWQIEELNSRVIVSFSDSHSLENLGREATVFNLPKEFTYQDVITALKTPYPKRRDRPYVSLTVEFYPEEGKYHYTGHRKCQVRHSPEESKKLGTVCPVCGRPLTVGVAHQVEKLAGKTKISPKIQLVKGVKVFSHPKGTHHPYLKLIPLQEIIAEAEGAGKKSALVQQKYQAAVDRLDNEFNLLVKTPIDEIARKLGERLAQGIEKNRKGDLFIEPGYDGLYGRVKIWPPEEKKEGKGKQASLF